MSLKMKSLARVQIIIITVAKRETAIARSGAHKKKERLTSTYTRGSRFVIARETALPCMEATKCLQTAALHGVQHV